MKRANKALIITIFLSLILTANVFALVSAGAVIIGDTAYGLNYANDIKNRDEISKAIADYHGKIYIKEFDGSTWIDNSTGKPLVSLENLPKIKNYKGIQHYDVINATVKMP